MSIIKALMAMPTARALRYKSSLRSGLFAAIAIAPALLATSCDDIPKHNPEHLCGVITQKFTDQDTDYRMGTWTVYHFAFVPHGSDEVIEMKVSTAYYLNNEVGDTLCLDFCPHWGCQRYSGHWFRCTPNS